MNKQDKINEAQIQLDNMEHYRPLTEPMVHETHNRVLQRIKNSTITTTLMRWLKNGFVRHQIPLEYQFFTPSLK